MNREANRMASLLGWRERIQREMPRGVRIRRGTVEDELPTFETMRKAMGFDMAWANHAAMRHHLRQSPLTSFWVAEETPRFSRPRVVGYARSVVRERVWSLTEFFVLPEFHRRGVGGSLLTHCLEDGDAAGAETRMVLASPHPSANALYIRKAGCLPRVPMLLLSGTLSNLRVREEEAATIADLAYTDRWPRHADTTLIAEPLLLTPDVRPVLDALDRETIGYARPTEHAHWAATLGGTNGAARLFRRPAVSGGNAGQICGYAYIGPHSSGHALARDPADLPRMMAHVTRLSSQTLRVPSEPGFFFATDQYCAVAGTNGVMLRWLLDCGWQIVFQYVFMCSRPMGNLDRYVCHNPLYVL